MLAVSPVFAGYSVYTNVIFTAEVTVQTSQPFSADFVHEPLTMINIVQDQIVISANLPGESFFTNFSLYYRQSGSVTYTRVDFSPLITAGIFNYSGRAIIPANEVTSAGIEYYLSAHGPAITPYSFRNSGSPQVISYINKATLIYSKDNNVITLKDGNIYDGEAKLTVNGYTESGEISFQQVINVNDLPGNFNPNVLSSTPVAAYQVEPLSSYLKDPSELTLLYIDINQDGKDDGTGDDEELLKLFWFDGFDWRYMGGTVDSAGNIVTSSIFTFGIFALFPASGIQETAYKPLEKIITPNSDGINDYLIFSGLSGEFEIKIVDIRGGLVRIIKDRPYWDGKDSNGNDVPGGVYFYQLKVNGKVIKGVFVNAR